MAQYYKANVLPIILESHKSYVGDGAGDNLRAAIEEMRQYFHRVTDSIMGDIEQIIRNEGIHNRNKWVDRVRSSLGVDLSALLKAADLQDVMEMSAARFATLVTSVGADLSKQLGTITLTAMTTGMSAADLEKQLNERFGVQSKRAKIIARDQMAKLRSELNSQRQKQFGVEEYEWSTSGDERVRPTHVANSGKRFRWDSPPNATGHPGHDIMCRCVAIAVIK